MENNTSYSNDAYHFSEFAEYIIGDYSISDCFTFNIYSDKAPLVGEMIKIGDKIFEVDSVIDDTTEEECEQGLSYSIVRVRTNY